MIFFAGIPLGKYLNQMSLNLTYADQVTLDAVALLCNIHILTMSWFGRQCRS